jgi:hypothetical protein
MNRRLLSAILMVASCCGCEADPNTPATISRPTNDAAKQPTSASSPATPSPHPESNGSREQIDANPSDRQQEYVSFPAAGVKLIRPSGFDDAENFHGFQQPTTHSSVMVVMIPGPISEVTRGFTAEQLKTRSMTLRSKNNVEIDGKSAVLLSVTQNAYGTEFAKWLLAFGNETETRMVTATFPQSEEANLSDELKAVVLSTKIDDTAAATPSADVGFAIDAPAKLTPTRGIGKMLMYTKDGAIPAKSREDPLFIAGPSLSKVPIDNKRQFAVQRLFQTAHTKIGSVTSNNEITIDGLNGYEILAEGEDADSGTPLRIYQVVLYDDGSYILMQGLVGANVAEHYLPEFKTMARSLTRNAR